VQVSHAASAPGDLIWSDEFEGVGVPDPAKWERLEYKRRNNENGPDGWWDNEDSFLDGQGNLVITCRKIENRNDDADTCDFSTGMVRSKGRFEQLYGSYEISCRFPTQPGWWVAFWMMQGDVGSVGNGGVDGTEVDIMEGFGWTDRFQHAFHWDGYGPEHQSIGKGKTIRGIREGFHVFAMEWYPEMYVFSVDGQETWRSTGGGVCIQPGYIKVTGELSTEEWAINSGWANHPADATYPDSFTVDYVRVYETGEYEYPVGGEEQAGGQAFHIVMDTPGRYAWLHWDEHTFQEDPSLQLYNAMGQLKLQREAYSAHTPLSLADLEPGPYIINLHAGGRSLQRKILLY
jgi:beta-glucanase (GH16 family)